MVIAQNKDSVFIAADTIYSGMIRELRNNQKDYFSKFDTLQKENAQPIKTALNSDSSKTDKIGRAHV